MSGFGFSAVTLLCVQAAFVFCICYAIVSDFTRLRIANWIPATLTALFLVYALLRLDLSTFKDHLVLAGIVFALGFASFVFGWIGGGDVKLLTALTLWAGPSHGPDLLILTTLGGGLMAFALLLLRNSTRARLLMPTAAPFRRIRSFAERGVCPYGLAMGAAALVSLQPMFLSAA
jgi:prepilin peptidase CpaA